MDLSQYRNFIIVVECGTITEAANKIHIAQPALSKQINSLEREYGVPLLAKGRGLPRVELTEAGKIFYENAKMLCKTEDNLRQEIQNYQIGYTGTLRLTVAPALARSLINEHLQGFHKLYPHTSFQIKEQAVQEQEKYLKNDICELGLTNAPLLHPYEFDVLKRKALQFHAICLRNNPYLDTNKDYITVEDLADVPLCLAESSYKVLLDVMNTKKISVNILSTNTNKQSSVFWAKLGMGVAVIPYEGLYYPESDLVAIPLASDELAMDKIIYKIKDKKLSTIARCFLDFYNI